MYLEPLKGAWFFFLAILLLGVVTEPDAEISV